MTGQKRLRVRNRAVLDAVAGATAGCVARFVVGPLDVLKIRFQASISRTAAAGCKTCSWGSRHADKSGICGKGLLCSAQAQRGVRQVIGTPLHNADTQALLGQSPFP